jgi:DNA polymerase-3 subunit delta'
LSKIVITDDYDKAIKELNADEVILTDELKIDEVRKIKTMAYIATKNKKTILIAAKKYRIEAQNALLKLLEEPPKNIEFILLSPSKYSLLDTVKSRLSLEKRIYNTLNESKYDFSNINNEFILEIIKEDLSSEEIKSMVYKILKQKSLNEEQMKILTDALKMLELNIDKEAIKALIMLAIKERT